MGNALFIHIAINVIDGLPEEREIVAQSEVDTSGRKDKYVKRTGED